ASVSAAPALSLHDALPILSALTTNFALYRLKGQRLDYWDANVFLAALLAGIAALVIVSLLTSPEPAEAIGSFFGRLETSSDDERSEEHTSELQSRFDLVCR